MPFSSSEIAQLNGMYGQMALQQASFGQMLAMTNPLSNPQFGQGQAYQGQRADMAAGWGMNKAHSIGMPLATVGLGMAGLDPFSLAFRGGAAGLAMGGVGGAIGGAALGFGVPMAVGMAANYGVNQMYQGAQNQQILNQTLRSNFQQVTNLGRGFSRPQMEMIGGDIFNMVGRGGPNGDMVGFEELTRLMGNFGRMGNARGLNDVKDVMAKFKQQLETFKTIAQELGTTLESAQQVAQSMKSSGVFRSSDQVRMAGFMKQGALAGISSDEVASMSNIGAQISRSIGGSGLQGAVAGAKQAINVGMAVDQGVLSEEQLYNATGLTGEAGRQAFGASMMQLNARFLSSGLGRRVVASVAGKEGQLNQTALQEYLGRGGFTTGGTMSHAHSNLNQTGRADFIYNEGRTRGAMFEADPFVAQRQMGAWLEQRGLDVNDPNDPRAKIFLQRKFKSMGISVGNSELEAQLELMRSMPMLESAMEDKKRGAGRMEELEKYRKNTGIQGIQRRLEDAREHIQATLQKKGAEVFNETSDMIERFMARFTDQYISTFSGDIDQAMRSMERGDNSRLVQRAFGGSGNTVGNNLRRNLGEAQQSNIRALMGGMTTSRSMTEMFNSAGSKEAIQTTNALIGPMASKLLFESDADRFAEAGYGRRRGWTEGLATGLGPQTINASSQDLARFMRVDREARGVGDADSLQAGAGNADALRRILSSGKGLGRGIEALDSFEAKIMASEDKGLIQAMRPEGGDMSQEARMRRMVGLLGGAGLMSGDMRRSLVAPQMRSTLDLGQFRTASERNEAVGRAALSGIKVEKAMPLSYTMELAKKAMAGTASLGDVLNVAQDDVLSMGYRLFTGKTDVFGSGADKTKVTEKGVGEYLNSKEGSEYLSQIMGDVGENKSGVAAIEKQIIDLQSRGDVKDLSSSDRDRLEGLRSLQRTGRVAAAMHNQNLSMDDAIQQVSKELGVSPEDLKTNVGGNVANYSMQVDERRKEALARIQGNSRTQLDSMTQAGAVEFKDGKYQLSSLGQGLGKNAQSILSGRAEIAQLTEEALGTTDADSRETLFNRVQSLQAGVAKSLTAGSRKERAQTATDLRKGGDEQGASFLERLDRTEDRFGRELQKFGGNANQAVAHNMGFKLNRKEYAELGKMGAEEAANYMMSRGGYDMSGEGAQQLKSELKRTLEETKTGGVSKGALSLMDSSGAKLKADKEKKEAMQRENDPLMSKIADGIKVLADAAKENKQNKPKDGKDPMTTLNDTMSKLPQEIAKAVKNHE